MFLSQYYVLQVHKSLLLLVVVVHFPAREAILVVLVPVEKTSSVQIWQLGCYSALLF